MIKSSIKSYGQSVLHKVFNKTNFALAAIMIGIFITVLVFGNLIRPTG